MSTFKKVLKSCDARALVAKNSFFTKLLNLQVLKSFDCIFIAHTFVTGGIKCIQILHREVNLFLQQYLSD